MAVRIALPGARTVVCVERELACAEILAARMAEGAFDDAPVWSDIRTFDGRPWRGLVDGVTCGFPCQDLSHAGGRRGITGPKSGLWSEAVRAIRQMGPGFVFLENVGAILIRGIGAVLGDLAEMGFDAEWGCVTAAEVGASHQRERWFCLGFRPGYKLAHDNGKERARIGPAHGGDGRDASGHHADGCEQAVDDAKRAERGPAPGRRRGSGEGGDGAGQAAGGPRIADAVLGDTAGTGREVSGSDLKRQLRAQAGTGLHHRPELAGGGMADADAPGHAQPGRGLLSRALGDAQGGDAAGVPGALLGLFAPGPGDARWGDILLLAPHLAPAVSRVDLWLHAARLAGLLPLGVECTPEEMGRLIAQAVPAPEAQREIRRVVDGMAATLDYDRRTAGLRVAGNGVVTLQAAVAFAVLLSRARASGADI